MKLLKLTSLLTLCLVAGLAQAKPITTVLPDSTELKWTEAKNLPPGAQVAVLMGNPAKKGPFITRVKIPAGYTVPVHSHPVNEYDTVISGTWYLGTGDKLDLDKLTAIPTGSFVEIPAHTMHYGITKEETVIQINGVGPWGVILPKKKQA